MQRLQGRLVLLEYAMLVFALEVVVKDLVQCIVVDCLQQLAKLLSISNGDRLCTVDLSIAQGHQKE